MAKTRHASLTLSLTLLLAAAARAQASDVLTPHRVAEIRAVTSAAISPDGKHVGYVLSVPRKPGVDDDGPPWSELHVYDVASGASRPFVTGKSDVSAIDWTPDGRGIAFVAKRGDDKESALYVISLDGGEARKAASLKGGIGDYSFAPDGKRVALVSTPPEDEARKKEKEKGFKQEIYEEDWKPAQVWIATLFDDKDEPRALAIEGSVSRVRWSPVDDRLAITVAPTALVDDGYMRTRVRVVDVEKGSVLAKIENAGKLGEIGWSPDGKLIAMIAGADVHDPAAARLMVAASSGGTPVELMPNFDGDAMAFAWQGSNFLMTVTSHGVWTAFEKVNVGLGPKDKPKVILATGGAILTSVTLSTDGQHGAFVGNSPAHPGELFTMSHGETAPKRCTDSNPWLRDVRLAPQEVVRFKARDGLDIDGVLIRPLDEVKGQRYPLVMYVHGGPEAHHSNGWLTSYGSPGQVAAARGMAVFHTNYRGSTGRGIAFAKLSQGDPAGKEFDDVVDAVDFLIQLGLVDKSKVGVSGGSYGGYATAWCSTFYSERFAAGVMFVGISDKVSKVGTTDIPDEEFYVHALKRPWEDWNFMLQRSPVYHADKSKTPLLILHGKDDPRVNPGQSREMYRHLKLRGKAPVRLVFYPGEGHGNRKAAAKLDYNLRSLQWLEHYLKGPGGEMPPFEIEYEDPAKKKEEEETVAEPVPASAGS